MTMAPPSFTVAAVLGLKTRISPRRCIASTRKIIPWLECRERRLSSCSQGDGSMDILAPLMLWAIVIAMIMFAVLAAKQ